MCPYLEYLVVARSRSLVAEQLVQVGLLAPDDHCGRGGEDQHHEAWPHLAKREYRVTWRLLNGTIKINSLGPVSEVNFI